MKRMDIGGHPRKPQLCALGLHFKLLSQLPSSPGAHKLRPTEWGGRPTQALQRLAATQSERHSELSPMTIFP